MLDKSLEEILKLADEMGIKNEVNSITPGTFLKKENGELKKVEIEELFKDILFTCDLNIIQRKNENGIS